MTLTQINKAGLDEIALDHVFTIGASGSSAYTFQGEGLNGTVNNPTLYLTRGKTYRFENGSGGHPIRIQSTSGASGTAYNTGVTNNAGSGTVIVEVQHDAPDVLYYQCTSHAAMNGILYITGALADGGVTTAKIADDAVNNDKLANSVVASIAANTAKTSNATHTGDVTGSTSLTIANSAVTTDKIANDAVTNAKIASGVVNTSELTDNAVTHAKYQDIPTSRLLGRTSSGTGDVETLDDSTVRAFLGVSAGANQTTINNNADNRVITGTGTANTLNGETNVHVTSGKLLIGTSNVNNGLPYTNSGAIQTLGAYNTSSINIVNNENSGNTSALTFNKVRGLSGSAGGTDVMGGINWGAWDGTAWRSGITVEGRLTSIGSNAVPSKLTFKVNSGSSHTERFAITPNGVTFNGDTAAANALDDYEEGTWTPYLRGSGSYPSVNYIVQRGYYSKIGSVVHVWFDIAWNSFSGGSNNFFINQLPFATGGTYYHGNGIISHGSGIGDGGNGPRGVYANPNSNYFFVVQADHDYNVVQVAHLANNGHIFGGFSYRTNT